LDCSVPPETLLIYTSCVEVMKEMGDKSTTWTATTTIRWAITTREIKHRITSDIPSYYLNTATSTTARAIVLAWPAMLTPNCQKRVIQRYCVWSRKPNNTSTTSSKVRS
jgi:hypothetical protein